MLLVTAATDFELQPFVQAMGPDTWPTLCTGVGPVEAAVRLAPYLATCRLPLAGVLNIGVAGAYLLDDHDNAKVLDICLAEVEVLADFGLYTETGVVPLRVPGQEIIERFVLDAALRHRAQHLLAAAAIAHKTGVFATVSGASATRTRGRMLAAPLGALCENMEGAAVARVCQHFALPLLELRCISNLVEDRDRRNWQLQAACARCGEVAALVAKGVCHA